MNELQSKEVKRIVMQLATIVQRHYPGCNEISRSWKNSEDEEYMWDDDLENNFQKTQRAHDLGLRLDRESLTSLSTNVVNIPLEPFVVKQDHRSFVDKIICGLNKAPDSPHLHTFSRNQFHCFHCKDALGDGEACQRCTCKRCGSGLSKGLCLICGNNQNSPNDSLSISANSSHNPPHIDERCFECGDALDGIFCQRCAFLASTTTRMAKHEVNEIRVEKIAHVANPLAFVAQQEPVYHPQTHPTHYTQNSSTISQQAATRNIGKATVNTLQLIYDQEPSMVDEDDETSKDKEIDKLMDLISLSEEIDQNDDDNDLAKERELLASLIEKLKCEIDESKNRNKFLETSNKVLIENLKGEIEDFKNKNKSLESSNNFFKEANNRLSETNNLLYANYKKSEVELARRNSKEYASQMELECAKVRELLEKYEGLETELSKSKIMSKSFESVHKHAINLELELQQCKENIKDDMFFKVDKSKYFCKEREQYFEIQDLKAQLQDKGIVIRVIPTTSVSRAQLKSNPQGVRVMHNNSQGKKQEVEDHHRSVKLSKNKTSVTACNDSLNAKTLNVKSISAMCDKCALIDKHDMCVLKYVAKPIKRTVASESNKNPRNFTRKLYELLVEIVLFIVDFGYSKHMTGNLKLLINFVEKFLGTVKFGNDQIVPILGYGDLVQGAVTIKRVYYVEGINHNLFSVGQFCDADLEFAFRKSTCFIRDLKGNDLLIGSRGTDLYSITLQSTSSPNPICLMAKAT
nr:integrase, catalytic region, zinc finger, CCHC-type, peptidase aspartic, catalytic [Tanacetum cinerariifolium]